MTEPDTAPITPDPPLPPGVPEIEVPEIHVKPASDDDQGPEQGSAERSAPEPPD